MRVALVDAAVRGPAGVADAGRGRAGGDRHGAIRLGGNGARGDRCAQALEVADGPDRVDRVVRDHRDPGRVVAAVLEPGQAVQEQVLDGALADISDDAAHGRLLSLLNDSEPRSAAPVADITVPTERRFTSAANARSRYVRGVWGRSGRGRDAL